MTEVLVRPGPASAAADVAGGLERLWVAVFAPLLTGAGVPFSVFVRE